MNTIAPPQRADLLKETAFYIPAKGSPTRNRYKLKHNDTFVVVDSHGDIGAALGEPDGMFNNDTRFLSRLELHVDGQPTLLLGSRVRDDNTMLTADLTNPDIFEGGRIVLPKDTVHIARSSFVWNDTFYTRFGIRNYGNRAVDLTLDLWFANDFADLFEVRGVKRARRGTSGRVRLDASSVRLSYLALDGVSLSTSLEFEPEPDQLDEARGRYRLKLEGGERTSIFTAVGFGSESVPKPERFFRALRAAARAQRRDARRCRRRHFIQRRLQRHRRPFAGGFADADDANARWRLPLCRHSLVFDHVWPGRHHHGAAPVVVHAVAGAWRAFAACCLAGHEGRSGERRGARQDRA